MQDNSKYSSVTEISNIIKAGVEGMMERVYIRGEITGFKISSTGHLFFSLKDSVSSISVCIWKSQWPRVLASVSGNLEAFQNEPELYLDDEIYADILDRRIVTVPFRFDFDNNQKTYIPIEHPISHLTLGQYKNCRIPVSSALTPYQFLTFVIRNFYHTASLNYVITVFQDRFDDTIFREEQELIHVNTPLNRK